MLTRKESERSFGILLDILLVNLQVTDPTEAENLGKGYFKLDLNNGLKLNGKLYAGYSFSARKYYPAWLHLQFDGDEATILGLGLSKEHLNQHSFKWNWHPCGNDDNEFVVMDRSIYNVIQRCGGIKELTIP